MDDEGGRRLLRFQLVSGRQTHPDLLRLQQSKNLLLIFQSGAGLITQGVTPPPVTLFEEHLNLRAVLIVNSQLAPDALVKILRQRLGRFHAQTVQIEVLCVLVPGKKFSRDFRSPASNRNYPKHQNVQMAGIRGSEIVCQAEIRLLRLPGKCEAKRPLQVFRRVIDDQVVAVRLAGKIAVNDPGFEVTFSQTFHLELFEHRAVLFAYQPEVLVLFYAADAPLVSKKRDFILEREDILHGQVTDDPSAEERRARNRDVPGHGTWEIRCGHLGVAGLGGACGSRFSPGRHWRRNLPLAPGIHDPVHNVKAGEGVLSVENRTTVDRLHVLLHVFPSERRASCENRESEPLALEILEDIFHLNRRLDQQAGKPDGIDLMFQGRLDNVIGRLLDSQIVDRVPVVRQDDIYQVLADVVDIALDSRQHDAPLGRIRSLVHELFEIIHGGFHHLGGIENRWELHLAAPEEISHNFHSIEKDAVDDVQSGILLEGFVEELRQLDRPAIDVGNPFAIDQVVFQALLDCHIAAGSGGYREHLLLGSLIVVDEILQRVRARGTVAVDEAPAQLHFVFGDLVERVDLVPVDDRRVQAVFKRLVQEDAVQNTA